MKDSPAANSTRQAGFDLILKEVQRNALVVEQESTETGGWSDGGNRCKDALFLMKRGKACDIDRASMPRLPIQAIPNSGSTRA